MKKMAIVPYKMLEEMNRWKTEHRPQLPPNPDVVQTVSFQKDMESVLQRQDLSETEKVQQYGQALHKFQAAHEKALTPPVPTEAPLPPTTPAAQTTDEHILESVPPSSRRKAKLLLQMLRRHPDVSYNEQGELQYLGKAVSGSNIIDLVNDVIRNRKSSEPQGWQVFSKALKDVNVPQEYVGNRKRWTYMQRGAPSHPPPSILMKVKSFLKPAPTCQRPRHHPPRRLK